VDFEVAPFPLNDPPSHTTLEVAALRAGLNLTLTRRKFKFSVFKVQVSVSKILKINLQI